MVEDLVNYHLKEIRCSSQCHTLKSLWIIVKGDECLILSLVSIEFLGTILPSFCASLSHKIGEFYFGLDYRVYFISGHFK